MFIWHAIILLSQAPMLSRVILFLSDQRTKHALGWAMALAPAVGFLREILLDFMADFVFFIFLVLLVAIDTMLAVIVSVRNKNLSSNKFARVFDKLFVYLSLCIAAYALAKMMGSGPDKFVFSLLQWTIAAFIGVREFLSIVEKASMLGYGLPHWIVNGLKDFADNGKFDSLRVGRRETDQESTNKSQNDSGLS